MFLKIFCQLLLLQQICTAQIIKEPIPSGIDNYTSQVSVAPIIYVDKLVNETLVQKLQNINYEISSRFFFKNGTVEPQKLYDFKAYTEQANFRPAKRSSASNSEKQKSPCSLYPTTVQVSYSSLLPLFASTFSKIFFMPYQSQPDNQNSPPQKGHLRTAGYLFLNTQSVGSIDQYEIIERFDGSTYQNPELYKMKPLSLSDSHENSIYRHFFRVGEYMYIVNNQNLYEYNFTEFTATKLDNYHGSENQIQSTGIISEKKSGYTEFFIAHHENIQVYKINHAQKTIEKTREFDKLVRETNMLIRSVTYDPKYQMFYVLAEDVMYVVNGSAEAQNQTYIKAYEINGTCQFKGSFKTTMHMMCEYKRIVYGMQLYFKGEKIRMNRYYSDWDVQGIRDMINIGNQKMIILGDEKYEILNYGINRNILLELGKYQPYDIIPFIGGRKIYPIPELSTELQTTIIAAQENLLSIIKIQQDPPELYCSFEGNDNFDNYTVLVEFNTSRCPGQKQIADHKYTDTIGSLETYCQIFQPIIIRNGQKPIEHKQALIISWATILLIICTIILAIGCGITCFKKIGLQIEQVNKKVEGMRKLTSEKNKQKL